MIKFDCYKLDCYKYIDLSIISKYLMSECFGELYSLPSNCDGAWNKRLIRILSELHCSFGERTQMTPNGIGVTRIRDTHNSQNRIGSVIASFIISSYITRHRVKFNGDGGKFTYLSPVNIVLETIDREFISTINEECLEGIISVLNHPHFEGCTSVKEIEARISSIKNLNDRFNKRKIRILSAEPS